MSQDGESVSQEIVGAGAAIAPFTDDRESFTALFDSFRAGDGESFRRLLSARNVLEHCEEVCQWIRSKDCVLLCLELAGPPPEGELPTPLSSLRWSSGLRPTLTFSRTGGIGVGAEP